MLNGLRLLLVEDDEDDYILTRDLLEEIHPGQVRIDWVKSVAEALAQLELFKHDLCLVDFQLGPDTGLQLLQLAQQSGIPTPMIMLTGHHDSQLDIQAQRAGAVDYLVKSELNSSSLGRSIRYALARHQAVEERLQRLQAESENRSKTKFLTHLSHELRTPLTSILGYTELLLADERESGKLQELRTIERNGRHLLNLVNDVLDLSRIEAGKLKPDPQPVQLEECIANLQSQLEVRAREKKLQLCFSARDDLPETILTDSTRLQQILLNLLGNAIKFTEHGRVELIVSVSPEEGSTHKMLFEVIDTGDGISVADQNIIFEPFLRSEDAATHGGEIGFGLGLAISRELAQSLGGAISCESTLGEGSKFSLTIDAGDLTNIACRPLNLAMRADLPQTTPQISLSGRVLITDDLEDIRQLLASILRRSGVEVILANNGSEAVKAVLDNMGTSDAIDVVVMDLQMPVLDGVSALRTLLGKGLELPVIALTASTMRGERERCLQAGFTDYLSKPVDVEELLVVLSHYLPELPGTRSYPQDVSHPSSGGTVLLVEDDYDARRVTATLLQRLGWAVLTAGNAAEAVAEVTQSTDAIDVALIDLGLPDSDGYQLAQLLRAGKLGKSRLIALSGAEADPERLHTAGFDAHVLKPIGLSVLAALLKDLAPVVV